LQIGKLELCLPNQVLQFKRNFMSDTNYIRINSVATQDRKTIVKYTDYRDQDKTKEEGRYEMKKMVEIPGVGHRAFELALRKLVPHFLAHCYLGDDAKVVKRAKVLSIQFKGEHRAMVLPVIEAEGTNQAKFKISGPEIFVYDAEKSKAFRTAIEDFLTEVEALIEAKDSKVQLVIDFNAEGLSKN
jgi:hypothetical protein